MHYLNLERFSIAMKSQTWNMGYLVQKKNYFREASEHQNIGKAQKAE